MRYGDRLDPGFGQIELLKLVILQFRKRLILKVGCSPWRTERDCLLGLFGHLPEVVSVSLRKIVLIKIFMVE